MHTPPRAARKDARGSSNCQRSTAVEVLHGISPLSAVGRHDAHLLRLLLPSSARCISGVCAAKRCRTRKRMQCGAAGKGFAGCLSRTAAGALGPGRSPVGFRPFPPVERAPPEAERAGAAERRDRSESAPGCASTQMGQCTTHRLKNKFFGRLCCPGRPGQLF